MEISLDDFEIESQQPDEDNTDKIIKEYLQGKVEDIKRLSKIAEQQMNKIKDHQNECLRYLKKAEHFDSKSLKVDNSWQKIYNNKWIIGITVEKTIERAIENVGIILKSNPKQDLKYSVKIFTKYCEDASEELDILHRRAKEDEEDSAEFLEVLETLKSSLDETPKWILSSKLDKQSLIIILLDIPKFIDVKEFTLHGIITFEITGEIYQTPLSKFDLKIQDLVSDNLIIKKENVIKGDEHSFLCCLATGEVTSVKFVLPQGLYRTLEGLLQIDCSFTKINIQSPNMFLIFDGKSVCLEHCILKMTPGEQDVEIIAKNEEQLYFLFHHFYQNIPDVIILSENYEQIIDNTTFFTHPTQSFLEPIKQDQNALKDFIDSFDLQLQFLEKHSTKNKKCEHNNYLLNSDVQNFRNDLCNLEKKTDEIFLKLFDKK